MLDLGWLDDSDSMLTVLTRLPEGLLQLDTTQLHQCLTGPTLIHLPGRRYPPLFVSVLLHGNESTGWLAVRQLLTQYQTQSLPRSLSLLIGNIKAAQLNQRHLDQQPDYNRIWMAGSTPDHAWASKVKQHMLSRGTFASVDVHNNTGLNPHYACVNRLDPPVLQLATLFARTVLYFTHPKGTQSMAFSQWCPAITIECGKPDRPGGITHAFEFLKACLHLDHIPTRAVRPQDIDLYRTVAVVKLDPETQIGFGDVEADICFRPDLDQLNFQDIPAHTLLGTLKPEAWLAAYDVEGIDSSHRFFYRQADQLRTAIPFMPGMLTLNSKIIHQDCLCYIMERFDVSGLRS